MRGMGGFVIGLIFGAGLMWFMIGGPRVGGNTGDAILKVSAKDTVIVSAAKYDTVIVSARKDTVIVSAVDADPDCEKTPRPPECPPKIYRAMQSR
jgi:hypothetical protein